VDTVAANGDRDLREMLDWAITQAPVDIALLDTQMRQLRLNASLCRALGLDDEAAGLGLRLTDLLSTPATESCLAAARMVARTGQSMVWRGVNQMPGQPRDHAMDVNLSPVRDPAGRVCGVLVVAVDVTEQRLARQRLALLNEASTRIGCTLDMTRTAEELVEVAVPGLADFASVDLLDSVFRGDEPTSGPFIFGVPLRRMACGSVLDGCPEALARPGQVSQFSWHSPATRRMTSGLLMDQPDLQRNLERWAVTDPEGAARIARYGFHSVMVVPLRARGATLGRAKFGRHRRPDSFQDEDLVLAEEIVARAAVCIDNARRYSRERATALTLQRSLLPQRLPRQAAVQVATRYLPSGSRVPVGGDWFDVIRLSGSRVGLVVGDVAGHGMHAAATMGRLRTAVRTLADIDLDPGDLLTRLDDVVTRIADEEGLVPGGEGGDLSATCLYAVYDPVSCGCTLARAGHPPPAVVCPGGTAEFLDVPACPLLGLGGQAFEEAQVVLPEDSLLVLYTDGLVESRQRDIDTGLSAMREVLNDVRFQPHGLPSPPGPSLESVCDTVLKALLPERAEDDAALLIARTSALPADRIVSWDLPAEPAVVAHARAQAARQLATWGLEEVSFTTELIVSELVTNAIRHAEPPIQLRMILDRALSCEVSDGSSTTPHLCCADFDDEGGRGLLIVSQLTERWGTRHTRTGKTIWAQQSLAPGPSLTRRAAPQRPPDPQPRASCRFDELGQPLDALHDVIVDDIGRAAAVDSEHPFPAGVVLEQRHGVLLVHLEAMLKHRVGVLRSAAAGLQPAHQFLAGDIEVNRGLHLGSEQADHGVRRLRLFHGPRETVQDITGRRGQDRLAEHVHDQGVRDQVTFVHVGPDPPPERGLLLDVLAEQVAAGDVRDAESRGQQLGLRSFSGARSADQQQPHLIYRPARRQPGAKAPDRAPLPPVMTVLWISWNVSNVWWLTVSSACTARPRTGRTFAGMTTFCQ
jgi:serine phosphatase RsbU (regulator of sigma subunit)/anti-sigma regulatory factor (Ser/Thr protein kinase)